MVIKDSIPIQKHPELINHETVVRLEAAMRAHAHVLEECLFDAKRELEDGAEIAYAVDFHEIYTYAYLFDKKGYDAIAIRYILNNTKRRLILPTGTIFEACVHLGSILKNFPGFNAKVTEFDKQLWTEACGQLMPLLKGDIETEVSTTVLRQIEKNTSLDTNIVPALKRLWVDLSKIEHELQHILDITTKMIGIPELIDDPKQVKFDHPAYDLALKTLEGISKQYRHRKRSEFSNIADALNLATVISVRQYIEDKASSSGREENRYNGSCFLYLLTHTPALVNPQLWIRDGFSSKYRRPRELIREPFSALYATFLENRWPQLGVRITAINEKKKKVDECINYLRGLPAWSDRNSGGPNIDYWDTVAMSGTVTEDVKLTLRELRRNIEDPVIEEIEGLIATTEAAESERRNQEREPGLESETEYTGNVMLRIQRLRSLISSVLDTIDKRDMSKQAFDENGSALSSFTTLIDKVSPTHTTEHTEVGCTQHIMTNVKQNVVLRIDTFEDKPSFYMAMWPCITTLDAFLDSLSTKLEDLLRGHTRDDAKQTCDVHIIAYTNKQEVEIASRFPLNSDIVRSKIQIDEQLMAVKVLSDAGDFFLDLIPNRPGGELYCGVTSYYSLVDTILKLFLESGRRLVLPSIVAPRLSKWLSSFSNWEETPHGR